MLRRQNNNKSSPADRPGLLRLLAVTALVALFGVGMCAFLGYCKFGDAAAKAARSRMAVPAAAVREGLEATLALGLPLASATEAPALLERERGSDGEIVQIRVVDEVGRTVFASGARAADAADAVQVRTDLRNSFDLKQGEVLVRYEPGSSRRAQARMGRQLLVSAAWAWTGAVLAVGLGLVFTRRSPASLILVAVMLGMLAMGWATQRDFEAGLRPELAAKARVVSASLGELVGKALERGIALPELVGVGEQLDALRAEHRELASLALRDEAGVPRFSSGDLRGDQNGEGGVELPLVREGRRVGSVSARLSDDYIRSILFESTLDLAVVFVVAWFLTRELLHGLTGADAKDAQTGAVTLARLRTPLFLFMLAEELTRAFVPGHARSLSAGMNGLPQEVLVGLPIVVFMLVVALGQPLLASWSDRAGHRRTMFCGAAIGVLGLLGAAYAQGLIGFMLWRGWSGLGWGMVFVAGQGLVIENTSRAERTRGFALFVGAITVAGVCGPPIGGMLADHLGAHGGFLVAAAVAASACVAVFRLPPERAASSESVAAPKVADFVRLLGRGRFVWVTMLAALPAKLILAGSCFYLVPVYALAAGAPPSVAGRAMMLYSVLLVLMLPQAARWVERGVPLPRLVGLGLALSSLGGFLLLAWPGIAPIYAVTALLGLGQGLSIAAQSSLLAEVCAPEIAAQGSGPVFGVYRLVERLGNASGPLLAGLMAATLGAPGAFAALAGAVLLAALAFMGVARKVRP